MGVITFFYLMLKELLPSYKVIRRTTSVNFIDGYIRNEYKSIDV